MEGGCSTIAARSRTVPEAIIKGSRWACELVGGLGVGELRGRFVRWWCSRRRRTAKPARVTLRGARLEPVRHAAPGSQSFTPEGGHAGVEMGEVTVG